MNFDHYANVCEDDDSIEIVNKIKFYNPNSNNWLSCETNKIFSETIQTVQQLFPMYKTIEFIPSGGTGANIRAILENIMIRNVAIPELNDVIMISSIEHSSISKKVLYELNVKGYTVIIFPTTKYGIIDIQRFKKLFEEYKNRIILVSCISVNNEIGYIQPIDELIKFVKNEKNDVIFHSDCACNLPHIFKYDIFPDIITFSCYKFYGPHIGMLLSNVKLNNNKFGTPDIKNFYFSSLVLNKYISSYKSNSDLLFKFKFQLKKLLYDSLSNNNIQFIDLDTDKTASNIIAFILPGIKTSLLQKELNKKLIAIGSGSACTTNEGSHTILAMGYSHELSQQLVRLSFDYIDDSIIPSFVDTFIEVLKSLKYIMNKFITISQKNPICNIIKPSVRKAVSLEIINKYDISTFESPTYNVIQISSAEQSLKGKNKSKFDDILTDNIKLLMKLHFNNINYKLKRKDHYHMLHTNSCSDKLCDMLSKLPGVSIVFPLEKIINYDEITHTVVKHYKALYNDEKNKFAIRVKIVDKQFDGKTNRDWEYFLGKTIQENFHTNVNLDFPDILIHVKSYGNEIFVGSKSFVGIGGLPCGSEGNMIFFIDNINIEYTYSSITQMYTRGTIPIVFVNSEEIYNKINIFLKENCIKYVLKLIDSETCMKELLNVPNNSHIVYETNVNNIFEMKKFGKQYHKYVFSNNMFKNSCESDNFYIQNSQTIYEHNGLILISGGFDSPVASHILSQNNINHDFIHFISSFDDTIGTNKIISLVKQLRKSNTIHFVEFGNLQEQIAKTCDEAYRVIMYKIYMVLIANEICKEFNYNFIAMGNSFGQVASQTPQNLYVTDYFSEVPVLSPLMSFNKTTIIQIAKQIGTEDISKCNGNDCCVQFLPAHPVLNASVSTIEKTLLKIENYKNFISIRKVIV